VNPRAIPASREQEFREKRRTTLTARAWNQDIHWKISKRKHMRIESG
jgi:hypothetical protein